MRVLVFGLAWLAAAVWLAVVWAWIGGRRKRSMPAVDWDAVLERWCRDEGCLHRPPCDDLIDLADDLFDLAREVQDQGGEGA